MRYSVYCGYLHLRVTAVGVYTMFYGYQPVYMGMSETSMLAGLKQQEYTGENRCMPCTVVNLLIAVGLATIASLVTVELGAVVLFLSILAIYFRGYLVPGTPTLTKRYLPNRLLAAFDKHPAHETDTDDDQQWETLEKLEDYRQNAVNPEEFLLDIGAVELCEGGTDLCFTAEFEDRVEQALASVAIGEDDSPNGIPAGIQGDDGRNVIAEIFGVDTNSIRFKDREYPAISVSRRIRKWPSASALGVDVAHHQALGEQSSRWQSVPAKQRIDILRSLRSFQETCPNCGGPIVAGEEVVESCCASYEVISVGCADCGTHLLELDPEKLEEGAGGFEP